MKRLLLVTVLIFSGAALMQAQEYQRAIGLRLGWDYGLSYKHFLNQKAAFEGVATFRSYGVPGFRWSYFRITGLYLIHNPFPGVEGLQWYYGGGASVSSWGGDYKARFERASTLGIGLHGALGLDYKIKDAPISLTVDWIPTFTIGSYYDGFAVDYGAFGVRYTF